MDILQENILPFWMGLQQEDGSFVGRVCGNGRICSDAQKGAILHARILWAFSASYRVLGKPQYLNSAKKLYTYFVSHFIDREFGGVYWSLDAKGRPLETRKQFYALGFAIYALSEYVRCLQKAGEPYTHALDQAIALYHCIEDHSRDRSAGGYIEATCRDWSPIPDMRLSERDMNASKTMNTHLHILEPYTNLYRVWPSEELRDSIEHLLEVFTCRMIDPVTGNIGLFFNDLWQRQDSQISFGHEIEAWWLLSEAAQVLGIDNFSKIPAMKALEGNCMNFYASRPASEGLPYEIREDGTLDTDRHWWVQAEAVVGFAWIYALTGNEKALEYSRAQLEFIKKHLLRSEGEWYWSVKEDGAGGWKPNEDDDIAGFWKCPYHNSRMCLEILQLAQ